MRILIALLSLSLIACPPKKPVDQPGDAASGPVVVGDPDTALPVARDPITECAGEPAWMAWAPCKTNTALYVVGKASGSTPLARMSAMNRARAELVALGVGDKGDDGRVMLRGSEVFDSFACKEETFALARLAGDDFAGAGDTLTAVETSCEGVELEPEEDADAACPAWTRRGAWREGDTVIGVGFVAGIKNRALATKTARNRALAEAQKVAAISLKVTDTSVSTSSVSAPAVGIPTDPEMTECDGVIYTKVTFARP